MQSGIKSPALAEAMEAVTGLIWNLEIKTADAVAPLVQRLRNGKHKSRIIISSFIHAAAVFAAEQLGVEGALLVAHSPAGPLFNLPLESKAINYIAWNSNTVSPANLAWTSSAGLKSLVYGFVSDREHARFFRPDVAAIITDYPETILRDDLSCQL